MSKALELLPQWAELQPERCKAVSWSRFELTFTAVDEPATVDTVDFGSFENPEKWKAEVFKAIALIQLALFDAIAQRGARLQLANASNGWHAAIGMPHPVTGELHRWVTAQDAEAAIAVLAAWVMFLQKESPPLVTQ